MWDMLGYRRDLNAARERVAALHPTTVHTLYGDVEYGEEGAGPVVLAIHGIFGGFDAGLRLARLQHLEGVRVVAPSRFGYLGSALPPDASPAMQADALVALLDALGIGRVVAFGASAGATSTLQLAIRHPDRVSGLLLLSSHVRGSKSPVPQVVARLVWRDLPMWAARRWVPGPITALMGVPRGLTLSDADRARIDEELDGLFPVGARLAGIRFDAFVSNPDINRGYPFEAISAPTLVVHAEDDPGPPFTQAVRMAARIPGARLVPIRRGGHLALGEHPDVDATIRAFVDEHAVPSSA